MLFTWARFKGKETSYVPIEQHEDVELATAEREKQQNILTTAVAALKFPALGLCLLVLDLGLLLVILVAARWPNECSHTLTKYRLVDPIVAEFRDEIQVFQPDLMYWNTDLVNGDAGWGELAGPSAPQFINLEASEDGNEFGVYGVTVVHQLHCLRSIHSVFLDLMHGHVDGTMLLNGSSGSQSSGSKHDLQHLIHCFDYVRQGIQCTADVSLERPITDRDDPEIGQLLGRIDGWGHSHVCRKWDDVLEWLEIHRIEI